MNPFKAISEDYRKLCDLIGSFKLPEEEDIDRLVNLIKFSTRIVFIHLPNSKDSQGSRIKSLSLNIHLNSHVAILEGLFPN